MKNNLIFCYILVAATVVSATDYCSMNCNRTGEIIKHIACKNNGEFGAECPKNIEVVNFTDSLKNIILNKINDERNFIAGGANSSYNYQPACRMATTHWDDDLAYLATLFAKECKDGDVNRYCHPTEKFPASSQITCKIIDGVGAVEGAIKPFIEMITTRNRAKKDTDILSDRLVALGCGLTRVRYTTFTKYWIACYFSVDDAPDSDMYDECESPAEMCINSPIAPYPNLCGNR